MKMKIDDHHEQQFPDGTVTYLSKDSTPQEGQARLTDLKEFTNVSILGGGRRILDEHFSASKAHQSRLFHKAQEVHGDTLRWRVGNLRSACCV